MQHNNISSLWNWWCLTFNDVDLEIAFTALFLRAPSASGEVTVTLCIQYISPKCHSPYLDLFKEAGLPGSNYSCAQATAVLPGKSTSVELLWVTTKHVREIWISVEWCYFARPHFLLSPWTHLNVELNVNQEWYTRTWTTFSHRVFIYSAITEPYVLKLIPVQQRIHFLPEERAWEFVYSFTN